eukprot:6187694-Pleurochrysis_carterae.AAC.2
MKKKELLIVADSTDAESESSAKTIVYHIKNLAVRRKFEPTSISLLEAILNSIHMRLRLSAARIKKVPRAQIRSSFSSHRVEPWDGKPGLTACVSSRIQRAASKSDDIRQAAITDSLCPRCLRSRVFRTSKIVQLSKLHAMMKHTAQKTIPQMQFGVKLIQSGPSRPLSREHWHVAAAVHI